MSWRFVTLGVFMMLIAGSFLVFSNMGIEAREKARCLKRKRNARKRYRSE